MQTLFAVTFSGPTLYVGIAVVLLLILWFVATSRLLGRLRRHLQDALAKLETELKRRQELAGRVIELFRQAHADGALLQPAEAALAAAAQATTVQDRSRSESALGQGLRSLLSSPDARKVAQDQLEDLQQQLAEQNQRVHATRRLYNSSSHQYNLRVEVFPSNVVAGVCGFRAARDFELEEVDLEPAETGAE